MLSRIENDKVTVMLTTVVKLAEAYSIPVAALLYLASNEPKEPVSAFRDLRVGLMATYGLKASQGEPEPAHCPIKEVSASEVGD
jgi:hypothetical protein